MKRSGIELRGRTGIAPGSKAGRHSEMKRSGIELRGRTGIAPGSRAGRYSEMKRNRVAWQNGNCTGKQGGTPLEEHLEQKQN